ncbi:hypothetical protein GCM10007874_15850 [Labrys miyagiensis]|uniref:Uncharacterized protein n=1 Tax=Labrys miyagiensis TaxID=346912 RepID=A0ABQ6CE83_9HYPH|nr:hypothetical protein GCM10007874_15850 [Labrys miyagiensis]
MLAHTVVERLGNLEAAAAHVPDQTSRTVKARDHAERCEMSFFGTGKDSHLHAGLGMYRFNKVLAITGAANGFGRGGVETGHAHGVGDGAEASYGLDRTAKTIPRNHARLGKPLSKAAERLFVEARQGCATELIINDQADRI